MSTDDLPGVRFGDRLHVLKNVAVVSEAVPGVVHTQEKVMRHLVALAYVRDHDECPQQDLADAFCMDANNVVLLLNELETLL